MRIDRVVGSTTLGLALAMGGLVYASDGAKLEASLVNADKNAARGAATVQVKVTGVEIVDPGTVGETVKKGQAHLHYTLDGGPVVATTATKLSFHGLKPGSHKLQVALAANDHSSLGVEQTLSIEVPASASGK